MSWHVKRRAVQCRRVVRILAATPVHVALARLPRIPTLVLAIVVAFAGWMLGSASQPQPARLVDLHELDGVAVRGGVLDLMATVDQTRPCLTDVRRWLWRDDPDDPGNPEWVFLEGPPYRPPMEVGRHQRYRLRVPVPAWVEPGIWHYYNDVEDRCPAYLPALLVRLIWPQRSSPDIKVRITDPTPADPAAVVAPPGAIEVIPSNSVPPESKP